ncbi:NUDIX domain-containing protein [Microbacterium sp. zg.Y909]|uniref:NUDIX domain-containing protein n=1 Tax=Microbacterium sp. zg.Y909 TaxID=2969413 RepID=UPI00214AC87D|nr:NUDIX domain-containing protein [Microbacterium sp. zg.Y909]MCR2825022.1 NUDIX domain-containing protein [Microbacterium sp. zg.Y909]
MTIVPPTPDEPRRPDGPRDPGDAWVVADDGTRYWGRFGAAGLLALDAQRGILLQHRVSWSHFGGTWGLPGGARHEGESAGDAALREAAEEAGVPSHAVRPRLLSMLDLGIWSYGTVLADVVTPFEPVISDAESRELSWVPVADIDEYPLHPGLAAAWPQLRTLLDVRPAIVVDAANVVGSVPNGWWRDRAGAGSRLLARVAAWARQGVDAESIDLPAGQWFPEVSVVLEGAARSAGVAAGVHVVRAPASGDDAIVDEAARLVSLGRRVIVVTTDRALSRRAAEAGAAVRSAGWLLALLPERP